jgi:MFS family permease
MGRMKRLIPTDGLDLLRRNRNFRRYYCARMSSVIGSQFTYAAVPLVVLADYRDPLAAGIVSACGYGGNIAFGIFAGLIVDRVPHRAIMLIADLVRCTLLITLGLLLLGRQLPPITLVYAIVLLTAMFSAAFSAEKLAVAVRNQGSRAGYGPETTRTVRRNANEHRYEALSMRNGIAGCPTTIAALSIGAPLGLSRC